jgi:hypothetical protein
VIWLGVKESLGEPIDGLSHSVRASRFLRYWGGIGVVDGCADEI